MAHQLRGGGGFVPDLNLPAPEGGGGFIPDLNLPLPEEGGEQAPPPAAEVDRISSLPEEAQLRILSFLPLKAAVKLGMVSKGWLRLVDTPQWPCDSILAIHIRPVTQGLCGCRIPIHIRSDQIVTLLDNELGRRGRGPGHRLLRFFLKVDDAQTRPADFYSLLNYATDCDVEDFYVIVGPGPPEVSFNFQRASHRLTRLMLFGVRVGVNEGHRPMAMSQVRSINTLEVICIRSTSVSDLDLKRVLLLCPRLRILTLRNCRVLTCVDVTAANNRLVRLTVAECPQVDSISVSTALGIHSFSYSGGFLRSVSLPPNCLLGDLYSCFTKTASVDQMQYHNWLDALPILSNLVNLTLCSNALGLMAGLRRLGNFQPQLAKLSNLPNLIELQLVMYGMKTSMLTSMYGFLGMCHCSRLRNLFVELPKAITDSSEDAVGLAEEPPMDGFENLVMVKINNFKWQRNEIVLVDFLFRRARSSLHPQKLIVVAPNGTNPDLRREGTIKNVDVQVLSESFGSKIKAVHRDIF